MPLRSTVFTSEKESDGFCGSSPHFSKMFGSSSCSSVQPAPSKSMVVAPGFGPARQGARVGFTFGPPCACTRICRGRQVRAAGDPAVAAAEFWIDRPHRLGEAGPAVGLGDGAGFAAEAAPQRLVRKQEVQALGKRLRAAPRHQVARPAVLHRVLQSTNARGDHGHAAGHRLQRDEAEALVVRRNGANVGGVVVIGQVIAAGG